jgi:prophage DNA circulation protein
MSTIRDLARSPSNPNGSAWRARLQPASYDGWQFHVESGARESGRRIVVHEFPKKEFPYSEDMGHRAIEFTVRGYCIQCPTDIAGSLLYMRDYTIARDLLQARLDIGGPGWLQLPTMEAVQCVCPRYRLTEEERLGGYCVFDMSFVEWGVAPFQPVADTKSLLLQELNNFVGQALKNFAK